jgi:hypothetical protein
MSTNDTNLANGHEIVVSLAVADPKIGHFLAELFRDG